MLTENLGETLCIRIIIIIIQNRRLVPLMSLVRPTFAGNQLNLKLIDKGILQYATISSRSTQNSCIVFSLNCKCKRQPVPWLNGYDAVVMTLENHETKSGGLGSNPGKDLIYYFFLLNYFCTIICIYILIYVYLR